MSHDTIGKVKLIERFATDELKEALRGDDVSINAAAKIVETATPELQHALASGTLSPREAERLAGLDAEEQRKKLQSTAPSGSKRSGKDDTWTIEEVAERADECLRVWSRVVYHGKLLTADKELNKPALKKLFRAFRPRMGDLAAWGEMLDQFARPLQYLRDLAQEIA